MAMRPGVFGMHGRQLCAGEGVSACERTNRHGGANLRWQVDPDIAINTYRNIDRLFPTRVVKAGETTSDLPEAKLPLETMVKHEQDGKTYDLYDFLYMNNVTGFLVMKDGKVVYEIYQRGNSEDTHWMSMSVAKSITSTLAGAAVHDGYIKSLDDNVVNTYQFWPARPMTASASATF